MISHNQPTTGISWIRSNSGLSNSHEALELLQAAGLDLFPLKPAAKTPRDTGWRLQDYSHLAWDDYLARHVNIGVKARPCDLFVDVDARKGGLLSLEMLKWDIEDELDVYPKVMTGRRDGGFHLYMSVPPDLPLHHTLKNYPGIDFQGFGRYVVGPGSIHPETGGLYRIVQPQSREDWRKGLPLCPPELLRLIRKPQVTHQTTEGGELSCTQLEQLLAVLNAEEFGQGGRHNSEWLAVAMACHDATNGEGMEEWLSWCAQDSQYGIEALEQNKARWESFGAREGDRVTYRTLLHAVRRAGSPKLAATISASIDFEGAHFYQNKKQLVQVAPSKGAPHD